MDYRQNYESLVKYAVTRGRSEGEYQELHHILPKSLGGGDDTNNLVWLSPREHFICHYLLAKMYEPESMEWYKMNHAFLMMKAGSEQGIRYFNSRLYAALRGDFSKVMRYSQTGKKNSQFGTMWITDGVCNRKILRGEEIPTGFRKGRTLKSGWRSGRTPNKGNCWINDGVEIKQHPKGSPLPDGWVLGLKGVRKATKWITNGLDSRSIPKNDPVPEGWQLGKANSYEAWEHLYGKEEADRRWAEKNEKISKSMKRVRAKRPH